MTDPHKIFTAYVGRTQISRVKILAPWVKRAQNGDKKVGIFVMGRPTMNSHFFVTGQIGMKFVQMTSVGVFYRTLIEKNSENIPVRG